VHPLMAVEYFHSEEQVPETEDQKTECHSLEVTEVAVEAVRLSDFLEQWGA
jgi:hypothetical protein